MKLRLFIYFFKTAFSNIKNNRLVHVISIGTITVSMLLLASFLFLSVNINSWLSDWGEGLSMSVYIEDWLDKSARDKIESALSDLENEGYACETFVLPACAFDAPHRRDRVFVVAYSERVRLGRWSSEEYGNGRLQVLPQEQEGREMGREVKRCSKFVADAERQRLQERQRKTTATVLRTGTAGGERFTHWATEPNVGRVAHGVPSRVDRLRALGNAVVPQVAEFIGRAIVEVEECA